MFATAKGNRVRNLGLKMGVQLIHAPDPWFQSIDGLHTGSVGMPAEGVPVGMQGRPCGLFSPARHIQCTKGSVCVFVQTDVEEPYLFNYGAYQRICRQDNLWDHGSIGGVSETEQMAFVPVCAGNSPIDPWREGVRGGRLGGVRRLACRAAGLPGACRVRRPVRCARAGPRR